MIGKLILPVIIVAGIFLSVFLISRESQWFSQAEGDQPIAFPQDPIITNITATSFTLSYFTPTQKIQTLIRYGKDKSALDQTKHDDRDASKPSEWFSHYVTLTNLEPNTTYFIKIETFGEPLKHDFIQQQTGPVIAAAPPSSKPFAGSVQRTARFGSIDTLIYLKTEKGQLLSTRPDKNGRWNFDLSAYRQKDLQNYYQILQVDMVEMVAVVGNDGVSYLKTYAYGLNEPVLLRLGLVKIPFYGMELGSSKTQGIDPVETNNLDKPQEEKGIIESIWFFITRFFGFD